MNLGPRYLRRRKIAELTSATGAGVLGAGIGLLLADLLSRYAMAFLVIGFLSHGWGMYQRHQLDAGSAESALWIRWVYWICWVSLAGLALYIGLTLLRDR